MDDALFAFLEYLGMVVVASCLIETKVVLITDRRKNNPINIGISDNKVVSKSIIKFLEVIKNAKLNFRNSWTMHDKRQQKYNEDDD